jgi:hypothetical protein
VQLVGNLLVELCLTNEVHDLPLAEAEGGIERSRALLGTAATWANPLAALAAELSPTPKAVSHLSEFNNIRHKLRLQSNSLILFGLWPLLKLDDAPASDCTVCRHFSRPPRSFIGAIIEPRDPNYGFAWLWRFRLPNHAASLANRDHHRDAVKKFLRRLAISNSDSVN